MTDIEELRLGFTIAFILWVIVGSVTTWFYIRAMRRVGGKPFLLGSTCLTIANMFEVTFFTYAVWFDLGVTTTHIALLTIPYGLAFRAVAYAIQGIGVHLSGKE